MCVFGLALKKAGDGVIDAVAATESQVFVRN
jgi:hypothetical protein